MCIPNDIKVLSTIEENYDVIATFSYEETTAWISVKDLITTQMYSSEIRTENGNKKDVFTLKGIKVILYSLKNYLYHTINKEKKDIFLGASTGLFQLDHNVMDSYFPYYDTSETNSIYMLNCGNLNELQKYETYIKTNNIVIENYLAVIFKKIFSKFLYIFLNKQKIKEIKEFNIYLKTKNINILDKLLLSKYCQFIAGYKFYKFFFTFISIDKAYVVSAPTKSDMVASLKSLGIMVVEIQHGIVGELHRGYNYNLNKDKGLPTVDRVDVYSQFWKDEIIHAGYYNANKIKIVGRLKYDIVKSDIQALDFKYIVFTGQGAFFEQIINFFKSADDILSRNNITMFYKAHPRELKIEIDTFKDAIFDLKSCEYYDGIYTTEEVIKNCFAHLSVFSSCHFDAIYYKNKTYILDVMDNNIMDYYSKQNRDSFVKIDSIEKVLKNEVFN